LKGAPKGYAFPIREVRLQAGGGFLVPLAGDIMTMPGLGRNPAYRGIDLGPDARSRVCFRRGCERQLKSDPSPS